MGLVRRRRVWWALWAVVAGGLLLGLAYGALLGGSDDEEGSVDPVTASACFDFRMLAQEVADDLVRDFEMFDRMRTIGTEAMRSSEADIRLAGEDLARSGTNFGAGADEAIRGFDLACRVHAV